MRFVSILILLMIGLSQQYSFAQGDSLGRVSDIPLKFITSTSNKIDQYRTRITSKTEKTLEKLVKWENKIQRLLQKENPATAERLFGLGKPSFSDLLIKYRESKTVTENYQASYNAYNDKLVTNLKFLQTQKETLSTKFKEPLAKSRKKIEDLQETESKNQALEKLIKERKKELLDEAIKVIGKSKYLSKINKETYYYTETLKNYKDIFSDEKKAEKVAVDILNKIPAVKDFIKKNSMLASLFGNSNPENNVASLVGLQTRSSVNNLIQGRIAAGGPNAAALVSQNIQQAQAALTKLKDNIIKSGSSNSNDDMPDFKPNNTKTKTFKQRLEFGSNFQFGKPTGFQKSQADLGVSAGYKLNDKSTAGVGVAYKMEYGNIQNLNLSSEGIGLRSFIDCKIKKGFFVIGGYEMNYTTTFTTLRELDQKTDWQKSGLIGITKKIKLKTKYVKGTSFQILHDFLYKSHIVQTQPIIFRVGYNF